MQVVFVAAERVTSRGVVLSSFDLPLATMYDEKFNQPVNNLTGHVPPVDGMGVPGIVEFRLTFLSGGAGPRGRGDVPNYVFCTSGPLRAAGRGGEGGVL